MWPTPWSGMPFFGPSFNSLAANGARIHCHLKAQTPDSLLCTASRRWCHLEVRSVRRNGEARRRVVSVGKLLQLSENAEDYRKPKKGLAKHSAAAQRKRCRAASRADASPRSVRGRSENIKIRLTRRRRDLVEIKINDKKKQEDTV